RDRTPLDERPLSLVFPELVGNGVVGDVDVLITVIIEISEDHTQSLTRRTRLQAGRDSDVFERAVTATSKENVELGRDLVGNAGDVEGFSLVFGLAGRITSDIRRIDLQIVDDEQIEVAVAVDVSPGTARAEPPVGKLE